MGKITQSSIESKVQADEPGFEANPEIEKCIEYIDTDGNVYCRAAHGMCWYDGLPAGKPAPVYARDGRVAGEMPTCKYNKPKSAPPKKEQTSLVYTIYISNGKAIPLNTMENCEVSIGG